MAAAYLFPCRQGKYTFSHLKSPSHRENFFDIRALRRFSRVSAAGSGLAAEFGGMCVGMMII